MRSRKRRLPQSVMDASHVSSADRDGGRVREHDGRAKEDVRDRTGHVRGVVAPASVAGLM